MAAEINALKGQLKLDPKLSAIAKDKKKEVKGENKGKKKNKKDTSNKSIPFNGVNTILRGRPTSLRIAP